MGLSKSDPYEGEDFPKGTQKETSSPPEKPDIHNSPVRRSTMKNPLFPAGPAGVYRSIRTPKRATPMIPMIAIATTQVDLIIHHPIRHQGVGKS
jgi:hypothetical protein